MPIAESNRSRGPARGRRVLLALAVVYLGLVLLGPPIALATQSLGRGVGPTLAALASPVALDALVNSVLLVLVAVGVNAVVGPLGAIALTRGRLPGRLLIGALTDLPLAISPVMIGLAFLLLLGRDGWLAPLLATLDIRVIFAFPGLVLATLFVTLPFTIREVAYVLEEVGAGDEEAATTLGASAWQTFWRVTLPSIRTALAYGLLMTVARTLGEFGAVLILGGSIARQTQTATTFIHDAVEERDLDGAYGMAVVLAAASIALLLALEWARRRREKEIS